MSFCTEIGREWRPYPPVPSGVFDSSFLLCSFYSRGLELALFLVQELWAAWFLCMRVQGIKCSTRSRHPLSSAHEQQQQRGARRGTGLLIWRQAAAQGRPAGRSKEISFRPASQACVETQASIFFLALCTGCLILQGEGQ